jgi:hypothetical protein
MKKVIRLTESDLIRLVKRVINETTYVGDKGLYSDDGNYEDLRGELEHGDTVDFKKYGTVYIISVMGDGYLVSDDEEQRYMGDNGDGYIIPLSSAKHSMILEKGKQDDDDEYDYVD